MLLATTMAAACNSEPGDGNGETQTEYRSRSFDDRKSLFVGQIKYPGSVDAPVGSSTLLLIAVCGSPLDEYCMLSGTDPSADSNRVHEAKVGARVRIRVSTDMPGEIRTGSSEVQPVLDSADTATWAYQMLPSAAGTYTLYIHMTALATGSDSPLIPDMTLTTNLVVSETFGHAAREMRDLLLVIAGILSALGISVGPLLVRWWQKERKKPRVRAATQQDRRGRANADPP